MHYEDYELAADAYRTLAKRDRSRADEAADGLDRVARAALTANDRTALASALTGLREVAPRRPLGRYVVLAALDAVDRVIPPRRGRCCRLPRRRRSTRP